MRTHKEVLTSLSYNLRRLRDQTGYLQQDFAKAIDTNITTVSRWEGGSRTPSIYDLYKISRFYGITVDEMIGENPPVPHIYDPEAQIDQEAIDYARTIDDRSASDIANAGG